MLGINALNSARELVELAGGVDTVTSKAESLFEEGKFDEALSLSDVVLGVDAANKQANSLRLKIFSRELAETKNFNSSGWLKYGIRESEKALKSRETLKPN